MIRRAVIFSVIVPFLGAGRATAQSGSKPLHVGWISVFPLSQVEPYLLALKEGLAAHGYRERQNLVFDAVSGDGDAANMLGVVDALVARRPDVIIAQGGAVFAAVSVKHIPIVFGFSGDPVAAGLTDNLARPSRNLTGITFMAVELNNKRLELLREFAPNAKHVVLMGDPIHPGVELEVDASQVAGRKLGIDVQWVPTRSVAEVRNRLASWEAQPPDALVILPDSIMLESRKEVAEFAIRRKIPAISGWSLFAQSGGLFTYGPQLTENFRRLADYVVRLDQGSKPSELPVERPARFELVVNAKTAAAIGLTPPTPLLARADEVVE